MKILITGFDPFNKETVNPAYLAVSKLENTYDDIILTKLEIPTSFSHSFEILSQELNNGYDAVIMVGQAGGRKEISLEKVAINYIDAKIADNDGLVISHQAINSNGKDAYFTTLPILKLLSDLEKESIPAKISYSAGTFVCNYLMYKTLEHFNTTNTKVGFIHVPYIKEQIKDDKTPFMDLEIITKALEIIIKGLNEC
jgi:pyroglutamyl-peptidase